MYREFVYPVITAAAVSVSLHPDERTTPLEFMLLLLLLQLYCHAMSALGLNIILKRKRVHIIGLIYERFFPVLHPAPRTTRVYLPFIWQGVSSSSPLGGHTQQPLREVWRIAYIIIIILYNITIYYNSAAIQPTTTMTTTTTTAITRDKGTRMYKYIIIIYAQEFIIFFLFFFTMTRTHTQ
jgi:hypothetical protein